MKWPSWSKKTNDQDCSFSSSLCWCPFCSSPLNIWGSVVESRMAERSPVSVSLSWSLSFLLLFAVWSSTTALCTDRPPPQTALHTREPLCSRNADLRPNYEFGWKQSLCNWWNCCHSTRFFDLAWNKSSCLKRSQVCLLWRDFLFSSQDREFLSVRFNLSIWKLSRLSSVVWGSFNLHSQFGSGRNGHRQQKTRWLRLVPDWPVGGMIYLGHYGRELRMIPFRGIKYSSCGHALICLYWTTIDWPRLLAQFRLDDEKKPLTIHEHARLEVAQIWVSAKHFWTSGLFIVCLRLGLQGTKAGTKTYRSSSSEDKSFSWELLERFSSGATANAFLLCDPSLSVCVNSPFQNTFAPVCRNLWCGVQVLK